MDKTNSQVYKWLQENPADAFLLVMQAGYATEWIPQAQADEFMNLIVTKGDTIVNVKATAKIFQRGTQFWLEMVTGELQSEITLTPDQFSQLVMDNQ